LIWDERKMQSTNEPVYKYPVHMLPYLKDCERAIIVMSKYRQQFSSLIPNKNERKASDA